MASQCKAFLRLLSCLESVWEQVSSPAVDGGGLVVRLPGGCRGKNDPRSSSGLKLGLLLSWEWTHHA